MVVLNRSGHGVCRWLLFSKNVLLLQIRCGVTRDGDTKGGEGLDFGKTLTKCYYEQLKVYPSFDGHACFTMCFKVFSASTSQF